MLQRGRKAIEQGESGTCCGQGDADPAAGFGDTGSDLEDLTLLPEAGPRRQIRCRPRGNMTKQTERAPPEAYASGVWSIISVAISPETTVE